MECYVPGRSTGTFYVPGRSIDSMDLSIPTTLVKFVQELSVVIIFNSYLFFFVRYRFKMRSFFVCNECDFVIGKLSNAISYMYSLQIKVQIRSNRQAFC